MPAFDLEKLKYALASEEAVVFAYLFGSTAAGGNSALSDVDIAVYPAGKFGLDERLGIIQENSIWVHKGLRKPQSYSEAIDILGENRIIPDDFAYEFARIAGFRNFLAHDYEKINYEDICQVMLKKLAEVKKYIGYIESNL